MNNHCGNFSGQLEVLIDFVFNIAIDKPKTTLSTGG